MALMTCIHLITNILLSLNPNIMYFLSPIAITKHSQAIEDNHVMMCALHWASQPFSGLKNNANKLCLISSVLGYVMLFSHLTIEAY